MPEIRTLRPADDDVLHRLLDRAFGHSRNWFRRNQPDLYGDDPQLFESGLVLAEGDQLLCHVATFPMELVAGPVRIPCGGIGNVATAPEARGKGYMSQLMEKSIERMAEWGWSLSVLWGDTQRYGNFGYARAGLELRLDVNARTMKGVTPATLEEVDLADLDVAANIEALYRQLPYRTDRPRFPYRLQRPNLRGFLGDDGYVIVRGDRGGNQTIIELASPTGKEPELVRGVLELTYGSAATLFLEAEPSDRLARLQNVANMWSVHPQGLFRIVDWPLFMEQVAPLLEQRAQGLPPFQISIGARWQDECTVVSLNWDGERLQVTPGREAEPYVELELRRLTRLMLGAPGEDGRELGAFARLLPVPVHVPHLDHV